MKHQWLKIRHQEKRVERVGRRQGRMHFHCWIVCASRGRHYWQALLAVDSAVDSAMFCLGGG